MNEVRDLADQIRKKPRGKQPISRHPLFPAIIGLWSGALLGLGSLALAPVPGTTARIVLALVVTGLGGVLGLVVARRIAHPEPSAGTSTVDEPSADEAGDPLWSELKSRRRALDEADAPASAEVAETEPSLEREPQFLDLASVDINLPEQPLPEITEATVEPANPDDAEPAPTEPSTEPLPPAAETAAPETAAERIAKAELADLSHVELLERLALSLQQRNFRVRVAEPGAGEEAVPAEGHSPRRGFGRRASPTAAAEVAAHEPMVVFPGNAQRQAHRTSPVDRAASDGSGDEAGTEQRPEDAEKALRDALAALQRMSGAA